jgi:hypothetical protein
VANKTKEQREEEGWAERHWRIFSKCSTRHVLAVQGLKAIQNRTTDPEARRIAERCLWEMEHCKDPGFEEANPKMGVY